jgi:hypothetical protein
MHTSNVELEVVVADPGQLARKSENRSKKGLFLNLESIPLDIDILLLAEIAKDHWIPHHQYSFLFRQIHYLNFHSNLTISMNRLVKEHDD